MIQLRDALDVMAAADITNPKAVPFSISYIKADRKLKSGGQVITIKKAFQGGLPFSATDNEMRGVIDAETNKRIPVHNRLILFVNDKQVFW